MTQEQIPSPICEAGMPSAAIKNVLDTVCNVDHAKSVYDSPIHLLPYDILYAIFLLCFSSDQSRFSIVASLVCRRWRSFALDSPILWRMITFSGGPPKTLSWEQQSTFLTRSGAESPLDIRFVGDGVFRSTGLKAVDSILRLILPHSHQWRSLFVTGRLPLKVVFTLFNRLRDVPLSALETLHVHVWGDSDKWCGPSELFLHEAPRLRHVHLVDVPVDYSSPIFDNLITLRIMEPRLHYHGEVVAYSLMHNLLSRSPDLQDLSLRHGTRGSRGWKDIPRAGPTPHLVHNHIGTVSATSARVIDALISLVRMPAARPFSVSGQLWRFYTTSLPVIARSAPFPNMTSFHLQGWGDGRMMQGFAAAMASMPQLEYLKLFHVRICWEGEDGFGNLAKLCPRLRHLALDYCDGIELQLLKDLVAARMEAPDLDSLNKLDVRRCVVGIDEDSRRWFASAVEFTV